MKGAAQNSILNMNITRLLLILGLLVFHTASGQHVNILHGDIDHPVNALKTVDLAWGDHTAPFKLGELSAQVRLRVDQSFLAIGTSNDYRVKLHIEYISNSDYENYSSANDTYPPNIITKDFTVCYRPDGDMISYHVADNCNDMDIQLLGQAHDILVTIDEIRVYNDATHAWDLESELPRFLFIELLIDEEKYDLLNTGSFPVLNQVTTFTCNGVQTEVELSWADQTGAKEYQLEWAYADNYDTDGGTLDELDVPYDLLKNSTRVLIPKDVTKYRIPLIFDRGHLVYRVRSVGRSFNDLSKPIYGTWSTTLSEGNVTQISSVPLTGHDLNKNWQIQSTYAEGGKRKDVVTYADGTTRGRQVVTRQNTDDIVVVGETIYDYYGRPAVQVLPVPVVKEVCSEPDWVPIQYFEQFNQNDDSSDEEFSWLDFDLDDDQQACDPSIGPMTKGAAYYYSSQYVIDHTATPNIFVVEPGSFIPESNGYPYSQIEYTPDKTGRKRSEGGVGEQHQIITDQTTDYHYGKPDQLKLDRLFGSEAGYASHYQKHVVKDPNGQISVSYMDRWGRVVATALAGEAPENLDALEYGDPSAPPSSVSLTTDLFDKDPNGISLTNQVDPFQDAIIFQSQLLVSYPIEHNFRYSLEFPELNFDCLDSSLCFHCVYDLTVRITDDCGGLVWEEEGIIGNFDVDDDGTINFDCDNMPDHLASALNERLEVGSYTITKILHVNEVARQWYLDAFLDEDNMDTLCFVDLETLIEQYLFELDTSSCDITCEDCVASLGTRDDFIANNYGDGNYYDQLVDECKGPCRTPSWCETAYEQMLVDVSPMGQYGQIDFDMNGDYTEGSDMVSVFRGINYLQSILSTETKDWHEPILDLNGSVVNEYRDLNGDRKTIIVTMVQTNVYEPPIVEPNDVFLDQQRGVTVTFPENLLNLSDFIPAWEDGWARSLIHLHPEYCYYKNCLKYSEPYDEYQGGTSDEFDGLLMTTETWQDAVDRGFINGTTLVDIFNPMNGVGDPFDPFFFDPLFDTEFEDVFDEYLEIDGQWFSMLETASIIQKCIQNYGTVPGPACYTFGNDATVHDLEWTTFKALYLGAKYKIQKEDLDKIVLNECACPGYNGCIGNEDYSYYSPPMMLNHNNWSDWIDQPWANPCQPCGVGTYAYFLDKDQRFIEPDDLPGANMSPSQTAEQYYLLTGQCPMATGLQSLLTELAGDGDLTGTAVPLQSNNGYLALFLAQSNYAPQGALPNDTWSGDDSFPDFFTSAIFDSDGLRLSGVNLDKTGFSFGWDDVIGFTNLHITEFVPPDIYNFTVQVSYDVGIGMEYATISGATLYDIMNCSFEPTCGRNNLGYDIEFLMASLASGGVLGDDTDIDADPDLTYAIAPTLRDLFYPNNTDLEWHFAPPSTFELYSSPLSPTDPVLRLNLLEALPVGNIDITDNLALNSIRLITDLKSAYHNFFQFNAFDVNGDFIATIKGEGWWVTGSGSIEPFVFGECELQDPLECQGSEYELMYEVFEVIRERILNFNAMPGAAYPSGALAIDLFQSPLMEPSLKAVLGPISCPTCDPLNDLPYFSTATVSLMTDPVPTTYFEGKLITFSEGDCPTINIPYPFDGEFSGVTDIIDPLLIDDPPDPDGNYHIIQATAINATTGPFPIYIHLNCLNMLPCDPCPPSFDPDLFMAEYNSATNVFIEYAHYEQAVNSYNTRADSAGFDQIHTISSDDFKDLLVADSVSLYIEYLDDDSLIGVAVQEVIPYMIEEQMLPDSIDICSYVYTNYYLPAYDAFMFAQDSAIDPRCPSFRELSPFYSLNDIYNNNLCCSDSGITIFYDYIFTFSDSLECPGPLPYLNSCQEEEGQAKAPNPTCETFYDQYMMLMDAYQVSPYYLQGGPYIDPDEFLMFSDFVIAGLCDCVTSYIDYINYYVHVLGGYDSLSVDPLALAITDYADCQSTYVLDEDPCVQTYFDYVDIIDQYNNVTGGGGDVYPVIQPIWTLEAFLVSGFCNCIVEYIALVEFMIRDGEVTPDEIQNYYDKLEMICQIPESCPPPDLVEIDLALINDTPCKDDLIANATYNAQLEYELWLDSISQAFYDAYTEQCLSAVENFSDEYQDLEYHYTLYYYDQGGSLIKTIPPEGVEEELVSSGLSSNPITSYNDPLAQQINLDRMNGTHSVFTNHRMPSHYKYNSLGQLTRQDMPDHDKMQLWETYAIEGLPAEMRVTDSQFPTSSRGYVSGWMPGPSSIERGLAFKSDDAGRTWQRLSGLVGTDLYDIHMVNGQEGYSVGDHSTIMKTVDGGNTWDMITGMGSGLGDLRTVGFSDQNKGFVAGLQNKVSYTSNGGSSFIPIVLSGTPAHYKGNSPLGGLGEFMVTASTYDGLHGLLRRTPDSGANWDDALEYFNLGNDLNNTRMSSLTQGIASGEDGILLSTNDGGDTWSMVNTHIGNDFFDVFFVDAMSGVALINVNGAGRLRKTVDGGVTWQTFGDQTLDLQHLETFDINGNDAGLLAWGPTSLAEVYITSGTNFGAGILNIPISGPYTSAAAYKNGGALELLVANSANELMATFNYWSSNIQWSQTVNTTSNITSIAFTTFTNNNDRIINAIGVDDTGNAYPFYLPDMVSAWSSAPALNQDLVDVEMDRTIGLVIGYSNSVTSEGFYYSKLLSTGMASSLTMLDFTGVGGVQSIGHIDGNDLVNAVGNEGLILSMVADLSIPTVISTDNNSEHIRPLPLNSIANNAGYMAVGDRGTVVSNGTILMNGDLIDDLYGAAALMNDFVVCGANGALATVVPNLSSYTFTDLSSPLSIDLLDVATDGNVVEVAGANGVILNSSDVTNGIFTVSILGTLNMNAVTHKPGAPEFISVGQEATIHRHMGVFRIAINDLFVPRAEGIHFYDASHGYMIADEYTVRRTEDGGDSWSIVVPNFSVAGVELKAVATHDVDQAIIVGANGHISQLDGNNASAGNCTCTDDLKAIAISNSGRAVIAGHVGNAGILYRSTDVNAGTIIWDDEATPDALNAVWSFDNEVFYVAGLNGAIHKVKNDGGMSLADETLPDPEFGTDIPTSAEITDIFFHDWVVGYVSTSNGEVYRATRENDLDQEFIEWEQTSMPMNDGINGQSLSADMDISTISFATRTQGFVGGEYENSSQVPFQMERYARLIRDESELISTRYWYDRLGRLVLSQNTKQYSAGIPMDENERYSYTLYDLLGRIVEAGEIEDDTDEATIHFDDIFGAQVNGLMDPLAIDETKLLAFVNDPGNERMDMSRTEYDHFGTNSPFTLNEELLRLRVSASYHWDLFDEIEESDNTTTYDHATHYSYDIHGNVNTLVQDLPHLETHSGDVDHRYKQLDYQYELLSGNVLSVSYQDGQIDQYHHKYAYDADNRISSVHTSRDGVVWEEDATYFYYAHGPLARVEIGEQKVQGIDYAYTLQGWLKGINSNLLTADNDMGQDGLDVPNNPNSLIARDVYGMSLTYFNNDYEAIDGNRWGTVSEQAFATIGGDLTTEYRELFNGNISHMVSTLPQIDMSPNSYNPGALGTVYQYDQLNRIKGMWASDGLLTDNTWENGTNVQDKFYHSNYAYDAMGNLLSLQRHDADTDLFDDLEYHYELDANTNGNLIRNRLYQYEDPSSDLSVTEVDDGVIDLPQVELVGVDEFDPIDPFINTNYNYGYDQIGNLIRDDQEEITEIIWTASGKIDQIVREPFSGKSELDFGYDATGQRIRKFVNDDMGALQSAQHYVRDAQGNIMAIYNHNLINGSVQFTVGDRSLYGSSRVGVDALTVQLSLNPSAYPAAEPTVLQHVAGAKQYELTDHLGNVHVTVSDQHIPINNNSSDEVNWYEAQVTSAQDYYPFGMIMPRRNYGRSEPTYYPVEVEHDFEDGNDMGWYFNPLVVLYYPDQTITVANGEMTIKQDTRWAGINHFFPTEVGATYTVEMDVEMGTANVITLTAYKSDGVGLGVVSNTTTDGIISITFTATTTHTRIKLMLASPIQGGTFVLKNFKMTSQSVAENLRNKYRFTFNGKETDNEVSGNGNQYNYGFRIYNPRLGRFLSVDPIFNSYPWYTPYQFAGNMPIAAIDLDGLEEYIVILEMGGVGTVMEGKVKSTYLRVPTEDRIEGFIEDGTAVIFDRRIGGDEITRENFHEKLEDDGELYNKEDVPGYHQDSFQILKKNHSGQLDEPGFKHSMASGLTLTEGFELNSSVLTEASKEQLDNMVKLSESRPNATFKIDGYASSEGDPESNQTLSEDRAVSAMQYLIENGVDATRLSAEGHGERAASQEEVRSEDRKVTVTPDLK